MNDLVSIIVPVYNVDKFLYKCIGSIINQSYKNIQIILVDDGSTDNSPKICDDYKEIDSRVVVLHISNRGAANARNCGMREAGGQYLCFIDSDDYIQSDHIEKMMSEIADADVLICKYLVQQGQKIYLPYKQENIHKTYEGEKIKTHILKKLLVENSSTEFEIKMSIMPVWKNLYKADLIVDNGIVFHSEREVYAEDFIFNVKVYSFAKKIKVSSRIATYVHLLNYGSLSKSYRKNFYLMTKRNYELTRNFLLKNDSKDLAIVHETGLPSMLAYSIFKENRCAKSEACENTAKILDDPFTQEIFQKNPNAKLTGKEKKIYFLAKKRKINKIYRFVRFLEFIEKLYRKLNGT